MKVLIWIAFAFIPGIVNIALRKIGISLGLIHTALLYGAVIYAARKLCIKYDINQFMKEAKKRNLTKMEYAREKYNHILLDTLEIQKHDRVEFKKQARLYVIVGHLKSADANVLYHLYFE
jgi:hypothetical protein